MFSVASMKGVDLDARLVEKAKVHLAHQNRSKTVSDPTKEKMKTVTFELCDVATQNVSGGPFDAIFWYFCFSFTKKFSMLRLK